MASCTYFLNPGPDLTPFVHSRRRKRLQWFQIVHASCHGSKAEFYDRAGDAYTIGMEYGHKLQPQERTAL